MVFPPTQHAKQSFRIVVLLAIAFGITLPLLSENALGDDTAAGIAFFEKTIRPVLIKECYECHSAKAAKEGDLGSGLQLDTREGIRRGGDTGPAVVPGKIEQSLLLAALRHEQDLEMPPDGEPLPQSTINDFVKWIEMGAPDPRDGKPVEVSIDFTTARDFWSLKPVQRPVLPKVIQQDWPRGDLDYFVLARRETKNIQAVRDAPRPVLLRRLFFDLIGLPPTPEELQKFETVPIEQVVDYLLASPRFGERWGRHWLDVARYAESNGLARNMVWKHAWRYRDWVIDAINSDVPYNRFVSEQIAGDLLPADTREQRDKQIIATSFLALGPKSIEETKRELFLMDMIDEQIDVICRGLQGLSVSCARCHDHKFDPVPTADYYSLVGILSSTDTQYGIGPMGIKGKNDSSLATIGSDAEKLAGPAAEYLLTVQNQTQKRNTARSDRYRVVRKVADLKRQPAVNKTDQTSKEEEIAKLEADIKDWDERIKQMDEELKTLVDNPPPQPHFSMGAKDHEKPTNSRIRVRGEYNNHGEIVQRGVLRAIEIDGLSKIAEQESGRLQLAAWLTSEQNPLTARVWVNRVWLHLFGRGLVDTPDDFGVTGSKPSHPLLLDHLAGTFMDQGWSTKELIRTIVLSRTYQMASDVTGNGQELDPDNLLLWHMSLRRMEVEPFRDSLLAVSGKLNLERPSGTGMQPHVAGIEKYEFNSGLKVPPEMLTSTHRSIYLPVIRGSLPEMLQLFDFADPNTLIGQRDQTTVPSQSLFLMNSTTIINLSGDTADRLLSHSELDNAQKLDLLYELTLSRKPSSAEKATALEFLAGDQGLVTQPNETRMDEELVRQAWISVCQAVFASSEFRHVK